MTVPTIPVPTSPDPGRLAGAPTATSFASLLDRLDGRLVTPTDPGWDAARAAWNLAVDQRPAAVVQAANAADVAAAIAFATSLGLRVAMQSTGHGAATLALTDDVLLVRTTDMTGVHVDPVARTARVEAGTPVAALSAAAAEHGLAFLGGSAGDVGVVGYTLGGGVGWLARRYGLACNTVVAAEVVTADGALRRVDAVTDPDLFWALRGGGGAIAAVTALEISLVPVAQAHAGTLFWPLEQAAEVLHAWRVWTTEVPDTVTSIARLLRFPPLPELPEPLRGQRFVAVEAAVLDDEEVADRWLRPLRALRPVMDTFATVPVPALAELHGDPPQPVPALGDHRLLGELPETAIDALVAAAGPDVSSALLAVDVRHLGGAVARTDPNHGALDRIEAPYAVFAVGMPMDPAMGAAIGSELSGLREALSVWDTGRDYLNFAERPTTGDRLFGDAVARLADVKRRYDPDGRFVSNHPVPARG